MLFFKMHQFILVYDLKLFNNNNFQVACLTKALRQQQGEDNDTCAAALLTYS